MEGPDGPLGGPDSDVQGVTLHRLRPQWARAYVGPYGALYAAWLAWVAATGLQEVGAQHVAGLCGLLLGQLLLVLATFWSVDAYVALAAQQVAGVDEATHVRVCPRETAGYMELVPLHTDELVDSKTGQQETITWFAYHRAKYTYTPTHGFVPLQFPTGQALGTYQKVGLGDDQATVALQRYGLNMFDVPVPRFVELFLEHAVAPFFVFQVLCVLLWCLDAYVYYSLTTLAMLVLFECTVVYSRLRNLRELHTMLGGPYPVAAYRSRQWRTISSSQLVPGDLVAVGRGNTLPCDMLLLAGTCIVNEAMLTGESTPTQKEPADPACADETLQWTRHRRHVLFGGTYVVHTTSPAKDPTAPNPPGGYCLAYVLQTGFHTQQGHLLRTIVFGSRRVTANNSESLAVILFLLAWALAAAAYVWLTGREKGRDQWKLVLECLLIITSVVPPELPMELSLAVNNSLIAMQRLGIFCTEPFRIPLAGRVSVCCFDKTGTLTTNSLRVAGVVMLGEHGQQVVAMASVGAPARLIMGGCHSLACVRGGWGDGEAVVGDPLERTLLQAAGWQLLRDDLVVGTGRGTSVHIVRRFHFSSALRRMATIVAVKDGSGSPAMHVLVKGAPEVVRGLLQSVPAGYDEATGHYAREGYRVLAMATRSLAAGEGAAMQVERGQAERGLGFAGLLLVECPLKRESKAAVVALRRASHKVLMITGDNPLTACHVATATGILSERHRAFILTASGEDHKEWHWRSVHGNTVVSLSDPTALRQLKQHLARLCITGEGLIHLVAEGLYGQYVGLTLVYARMTPDQKEAVVVTLRQRGHVVAMCGDGTNDVGALKQAHVGVALLEGPWGHSYHDFERRTGPSRRRPASTGRNTENDMELDVPQVAQLGDASIASPFAAKVPSPLAVVHIVRQGRCTLVTTLQMYRMLALNSLVSAYCLSALSVDAIKFSDTQYTIEGLYMAACFLFVSRSRPLAQLSSERPLGSVFNGYLVATVMAQFACHVATLLHLVHTAKVSLQAPYEAPDAEADFAPSLVNTVVYLVGVHVVTSNFAVNCKGRPFMEGLLDNRLLAGTLAGTLVLVHVIVLGWAPNLAEWLELLPLPHQLGRHMSLVLLLDLAGAWACDHVCRRLLAHTPSVAL